MKIAYTLHRRGEPEPATALLVPGNSARDVFDLLERLGLDTLPEMYATCEGFLVRLSKAQDKPLAGVVRLRELTRGLYLPVDADLVPPLLPDEAQGLVKARGLVFLPGGRVLEVAPSPISPGQLLRFPPLHADDWQTLPEPEALADELLEVTSDAPPPPPDAIIEQGRADIGSEAPRPSGTSSLGAKVAGGAAYAAGKSLAWLGTKLGLGGVAGAGAKLLQRALDLVPRLSERLMGAQEAALRALLRDFREGKIEQALRRALPLNAPPTKPVAPSASAQLPRHKLFYSLRNLLAGRHDPGSVWFSPDEVFWALQTEYRKEAAAAAQRGDYRRAAFIYAKLLNDMPAAAHILAQGGLHQDAAIIFQEVLHDKRNAARQWQAAGDIDKAVELYAAIGDDLAAADVLRGVGEDERALVYFRRAADKLKAQGKFAEAGDIYLKRAERRDLALAVFEDGWRTRPLTSAQPCGLALANQYSLEPNPPRFLEILNDAEGCLPTWSGESTVHFFNQMARLANQPELASIAATAQDRCLLALAEQMRQAERQSSAARSVSRFFPADSPWPAPVVRDAQFALAATAVKASSAVPRPLARLGNSTVRAVCFMPLSLDLFLGFENGEIMHHRLATGLTRTLARQGPPVAGLLADPKEQYVLALRDSGTGQAEVLMGARWGLFHLENTWQLRSDSRARLCGGVVNQPSPFFGVVLNDRCQLYRWDNPSWSKSVMVPGAREAMVGSLPGDPETPWCLLFKGDGMLFAINADLSLVSLVESLPENAPRNTLRGPLVQGWVQHSDVLTAYWITKDGRLLWRELLLRVQLLPLRVQLMELSPKQPEVRTARPILGIHGAVARPRPDQEPVSLWDSLEDAWFDEGQLFNPVAAFPLPGSEILLVDANGALTRVHLLSP